MFRLLRIAVLVVSVVATSTALLMWSAYCGIRHVRPFYRQALDLDPVELQKASKELATQAGALYSDTQHSGTWKAVFTSGQLNGWLAMELARSDSKWLPASVRDPRLAISPDKLRLGFRKEHGGVDAVVSVDAEVFVAESGVLAVRLCAVQVGALPLPAAQVVEEIRSASRSWSVPVRWTRYDGDVVALVDLGMSSTSNGRRVLLDTIELHEGEIYVAGHTEPSGGEKRLVDAPVPPSEHDVDANLAESLAECQNPPVHEPLQVAEREFPVRDAPVQSAASDSSGRQSSRQ